MYFFWIEKQKGVKEFVFWYIIRNYIHDFHEFCIQINKLKKKKDYEGKDDAQGGRKSNN